MRWDERQLAMLREIGVRLWLPPGETAEAENRVAAPVAASVAIRPTRPAGMTMTPAAAAASPAAPEPVATAPLDWPALRDAAAGCTACALCEGRHRSVFGVGHERAHWMIVGEAPGEAEDADAEPFLGKAGQLLDNMLRAIGLTRADAAPAEQVYIAHAVKCRPPGNRVPTADELAQCEGFLIRQVQLVQPRIILAMGRFAPRMLGSAEPGGKLRGRVHRYHGVPVIVTYGPAHLLRNPEDKARAWDDLCLAAETLRALVSTRLPAGAAWSP